ncbi:hypothetical protein [Coleofasciculus sp. FACHB-1120]|uniref:hypothetical protein n=1 Tax=Coleofasciculus sp. FACHB-1120 TaxID=2692783 RepID=UPI0016822C1F|nr:hypothetical protein [Coleofasciculus sp. FACHB-1120]MBD2743418.1 hypothetical protein [Coleofasciculus sp. FACHB-1120]
MLSEEEKFYGVDDWCQKFEPGWQPQWLCGWAATRSTRTFSLLLRKQSMIGTVIDINTSDNLAAISALRKRSMMETVIDPWKNIS